MTKSEQLRIIIQDAQDHYIAEDGLMALRRGEFRENPHKNYLKNTVNNDNGILWLAYFAWLVAKEDYDLYDSTLDIYGTIERLQEGPGYYNRNPGRNDDRDKIDNYVAIASLCVLERKHWAVKDIVLWGNTHGWMFDNVTPENPDPSTWRQGSDVAHYKLCAGIAPAPWEILWLIGGIIQNTFQDPVFRTSETLLNWLRIESITLMQKNLTGIAHLYASLIRATGWFWNWRVKKKTGGIGIKRVLDECFVKEHPIRRAAEVVYG